MDNIATLKLISGEELIAEVQSGPNPLYLTLVNPVLVHKTASPFGPMLSVSHWLMFTKENNIQIDRKNVVALKYGLEDNTIQHYLRFRDKRNPVISLQEQDKLDDILKKAEERILAEAKGEDYDIDIQLEDTANTTIH